MLMQKDTARGLKSRNVKWMVGVLLLDIIVIFTLAFPAQVEEINLTTMAALRLTLSAALPFLAILFSTLITSNLKAITVFWRFKNPLPGSRAFSIYAAQDARIDINALRKNVGTFPSDAREQNVKWYKLYKLVESEKSVEDSQSNFLLFREVASSSLLLLVIVPATLFAMDFSNAEIKKVFFLFIIQYFLTAVAAKNCGIRFVQSVLAIHAARKVAGAKPTAARRTTTSNPLT